MKEQVAESLENTQDKQILSQREYRTLPYLSSSDIKLILENPYLYKIGYKKEQTDSMLMGSVIHALIIEPENFNRDYLVCDLPSLKTKAGKEEFEKVSSENKDKMIITQAFYEKCNECAEALLKSEISNLFKNGKGEHSFYGEIDGVKCKCRPDYFLESGGRKIIIDLKTTRFNGASADSFQKAIANFSYYIQASFYTDILRADEFIFVALETEYPYMIGVYELDNVSLEFGRSEVKRAIEIYKNIDKVNNVYLDTQDYKKKQMLTLPNYVFYRNGAKMS